MSAESNAFDEVHPDSRPNEMQAEYGHHLVDEMLGGRITRQDLIRRATVLGLSSSALTALLAARGAPAMAASTAMRAVTPKRGGTLRVGHQAVVTKPDPVTMGDSFAAAFVQQIAEYLAVVDQTGKIQPSLAKSWKPLDRAGSRWQFDLRRGVRFNDGKSFTSRDVITSLKRLTNPQSRSGALQAFQGVLSADGITKGADNYTVVFELERPFVDFPYLLTGGNRNAVMLPSNYKGDFLTDPRGTGPFKLVSYTPRVSAVFQRNPLYWNKSLPYVDKLQITYFADAQPMVLALKGGSLDILFGSDQSLYNDSNFTTLRSRGSEHQNVHMRVDMEPFNNSLVRQAVAWALNRQEIVTSIFAGRAVTGSDHIWAGSYAVQPDVPKREQNLDKARQLLSQAGLSNGFETQITSVNIAYVPDLMALMAAQLARVNIRVKVNPMPSSAYFGSGANQPWLQVPFGMVGWSPRPLPQQFITPAFLCGGVWNAPHWCNNQFTKLAKSYDSTVDESSRRKIATGMAKIMQDKTPSILAAFLDNSRSFSKKVRGADANFVHFNYQNVWLA